MEIKRDFYLQKLINRIGSGLIKVITGLRRSGKSYLLFNIFYDYLLKKGVEKEHIILIQLDRGQMLHLRDPDELYKYVKSKITDNSIYYLFIDEIQECKNFELVLNDFLYEKNIDVYVTGSNSKLLSSDVITEFRGRADEIRLYPLTFKEFYSVSNKEFDEALLEYRTYGGMPLVLSWKNDDDKANYLKNLFELTYLKDIKERNKIDDTTYLDDLLNILSSSIGSLTNVTKIIDTFISLYKINISPTTIKKYLEILENAYLIQKVYRYDIKGRKYINTPSKYFFSDVGLRNARLNFRQNEGTHLMENIIYNELLVRGYSIDVGVIEINERQANKKYVKKQLECDFIINKSYKKIYIQSAYHLDDDEKIYQEKRPLINIKDSFQKIIIVNDNIKHYIDDNGIYIISLKEFLLSDDIF